MLAVAIWYHFDTISKHRRQLHLQHSLEPGSTWIWWPAALGGRSTADSWAMTVSCNFKAATVYLYNKGSYLWMISYVQGFDQQEATRSLWQNLINRKWSQFPINRKSYLWIIPIELPFFRLSGFSPNCSMENPWILIHQAQRVESKAIAWECAGTSEGAKQQWIHFGSMFVTLFNMAVSGFGKKPQVSMRKHGWISTNSFDMERCHERCHVCSFGANWLHHLNCISTT